MTKSQETIFVQFDFVSLAVKNLNKKTRKFPILGIFITFANSQNNERIIRYKKYTRDKKFLWALDRVFNDLQGVAKCSDLKQLSYLLYEQLRKIGLSSVRVMNGRVERLLFQELENGIRITVIELDESHYGQR